MFEDLKGYGPGIYSIFSKQAGQIEIELSIHLSHVHIVFWIAKHILGIIQK